MARSYARTSRRLGRRGKNQPPGEPEDHALGRSQGGFGTKLHLICDGAGTPIAVAVGPGQQHETQQAIPLLEEATAWPEQPAKVAGDKGYSSAGLRNWLQQRDIDAVIPYRHDEMGPRTYDREAYRERPVIERTLKRLRRYRRVATRYEKLASSYLAMVTIAMVVEWI